MGTYIQRRQSKLCTTLTADQTLTIPGEDTTYMLDKAGVLAVTLPPPTAGDHDGLILRFINVQARANTVSVSAGFGGAGGGADIATSSGAISDALTVLAHGGQWYALSLNGYTIA